MISVLILTKDEEANIAACLRSVRWSDDIWVLDDGSSDRTVTIARDLGAKVIQHSAGGENAQRTYSLQNIPFAHEWVYNPDADEITTEQLRDEMLSVVRDGSRQVVAYRVRFKNMFLGAWVKRSSIYPTWVVRLFKPNAVSFDRSTNLEYIISGLEGRLSSHFLHYSFRKGMSNWFEKHNKYSDLEAREAIKHQDFHSIDWKGLAALSDPARRRKALKGVAWRIPYRFVFVFFYLLFVRRGILDGRKGIIYCFLRSSYELMIDVKIEEIRSQGTGASSHTT